MEIVQSSSNFAKLKIDVGITGTGKLRADVPVRKILYIPKLEVQHAGFQKTVLADHRHPVVGAFFAADPREIVSASRDGAVFVWRYECPGAQKLPCLCSCLAASGRGGEGRLRTRIRARDRMQQA